MPRLPDVQFPLIGFSFFEWPGASIFCLTRQGNFSIFLPLKQEFIMPYGYQGKILHVDLSSATLTIEEPPEAYYRQSGWDVDSGFPTRQTLERLGLEWAADSLHERGKLR
jgi:hypothetical protein